MVFVAARALAHTGWLILGCRLELGVPYLILYSLTLGIVIYHLAQKTFIPFALLSLAAFPPTLIFLPKVTVLSGLLPSVYGRLLSAALVATSLVSLMFYLKFILAREATYKAKVGAVSVLVLVGGGSLFILI